MEFNRKLEHNLKVCDRIVLAIVFMVIVVHLLTTFYMEYKSNETSASVENLVKLHESNPFIKIQLLSDKLLNMIFVILKPAFVIYLYWLIRRKVVKGKVDIETLSQMVVLMFITLSLNILNDLGHLAGVMAKFYGL